MHAMKTVFRSISVIVTALLVGSALAGCSSGPSTKAEVCEKYEALSAQVLKGNGFGNPVFDAVDALAGKADAYEGDTDVQADGEQLRAIADSDSTSIGELESATSSIGSLCGGSLLMNALSGS